MSNEKPQLSRRDWFRLGKSASRRPNQKRLGSKQPAGMHSVAEPVNHGGVDLSTLPPMHEAILDSQDVTSLFADIEQHGSDITLIFRRAAGNAPDQTDKLKIALNQILNGNVRKLQIRYHWENANWIDTLETQSNGFRLVRIQHG